MRAGVGEALVCVLASCLASSGARAAASLSATTDCSPGLVSTGHKVKVIAEVGNLGDIPAKNVAPCDTVPASCPVPSCIAVAETTAGSVTWLSGPVPSCTVYLAADESATFTWEFLANSAGEVRFTVTFTGQEDSAPDVTASASGSLTILGAASLSATLLMDPACPPACSLDYRETATIYLEVGNIGGVAASGVCPAPLSTQGPGGLTILSFPSCVDLGAGTSHSFSWFVMATTPGGVTVYSSAAGQDESGGDLIDIASNSSSMFLDLVAPCVLSFTLAGSGVLMRGEESDFLVSAANLSSTVLCQSGFVLALNGAGAEFSIVSVVPLLPRCYTPGQTREFTLRARLLKSAPGGPGLVTVSAVGSEQYTGVPLVSMAGAMPVVVFEGSPGITEVSPNPYRVLQDGKLRIRYVLGEDQAGHGVSIKVYSITGELVKTLVDSAQNSGGWEALWDGKNSEGQTIASGVYIIMFEARFCKGLRKLAVIK